MNAKPWSSDAIDLAVDVLVRHPMYLVSSALSRCATEIRGNGYQVTLAFGDITGRMGIVNAGEVAEAECRAAWDALLNYGRKYIIINPEGEPEKIHYFGMTIEIPPLEPRMDDCLRRIGHWRAIKFMSEDDYPHVQRRFFDEYRNWTATDTALKAGALDGNQAFRELVDHTVIRPKLLPAAPVEAKPERAPIPPPRPRIQARNTKEALRAQLEQWKAAHPERTGEKSSA